MIPVLSINVSKNYKSISTVLLQKLVLCCSCFIILYVDQTDTYFLYLHPSVMKSCTYILLKYECFHSWIKHKYSHSLIAWMRWRVSHRHQTPFLPPTWCYQQSMQQSISLLQVWNKTADLRRTKQQLIPKTQEWKYCKNSSVITLFLMPSQTSGPTIMQSHDLSLAILKI
jgi:hypothetical protein